MITRPEFLNRIDEPIVFRGLNKGDVRKICDILLNDIYDRLEKKNISLVVTPRFKDRVIEEGFDPVCGARPLRYF